MRIFDASSVIHAWDNYPASQFPKLWRWIGGQIEAKEFCIARAAFEEVKLKSPECADWLTDAEIIGIVENNAILTEALRLKKLLGIQNDQYGGGVGENDLLIVATAKVEGADLVSDEKKQPLLPTRMPNYKIPAVCGFDTVEVTCINFVELIKQSGSVF
jgi:hypothetical protein